MHDKDATPIEAIDFEPQQQSTQQTEGATPLLQSKSIAWLVFIFLLLCGLMVFLFLPDYVAEKQNIEADVSEKNILEELSPNVIIDAEPAQEPLLNLSPEEISALKLEAEERLLQIIDKQKLLESKAVKQWAAEKYNAALTLGSTGDEYYRKQEYQQAIASYDEAVIALNNIEALIAPTLAEHLQKGELSLTQAESSTALIHFELAKSIDPENQQAINGLKRAETIKELYTLLEKGGAFEASNQFNNAQDIYHKATKLDPLSSEAELAFNRVSKRITENEFNRLINNGYNALKLRQYGDARVAFTAAQKLLPNSSKPKQGIATINKAIHKEKIAALIAEAQHFEEAEDWSNAVESYQQILALSPNSSTAQQGLENNRQRERILANLDAHIKNKLRLSNEQVAKEARQVLSEISSINNPGLEIKQGAITLENLLQLAKQPVSITLQSDNLTDIVIFKVGKFGKLEQRKLDLKIGKYTVVGSRQGYRDVRKTFTVSSDMPEKTIIVRCDEPI